MLRALPALTALSCKREERGLIIKARFYLQLCANIVHHSPQLLLLLSINGDAPTELSQDDGVGIVRELDRFQPQKLLIAEHTNREPSLTTVTPKPTLIRELLLTLLKKGEEHLYLCL